MNIKTKFCPIEIVTRIHNIDIKPKDDYLNFSNIMPNIRKNGTKREEMVGPITVSKQVLVGDAY